MPRAYLVSRLRRLFRFRLTTLFWLVLVAGVLFAWWADRRKLERKLEDRDDLLSALRMAELYNDHSYMPGTASAFRDFHDVESLLESIQEGSHWSYDESAGELCNFRFDDPWARDAIPGLIRLLKHRDAKVRRRAVYALGMIGPENKNDILILVDALGDEECVRREAAKALFQLEAAAPYVRPLLLPLLDGDRPTELDYLLGAIRKTDNSFDLIPQLIPLLTHPLAETRTVAAQYLIEFAENAASAVPLLTAMLNDDDPKCRRAAAKALCEIAPPDEGLPTLMRAFKAERDPIVRKTCAWCISRLDRRRVEPELKEIRPMQ